MRNSRKPFIVLVAVALVAALGVGATVAWLTDKTDEVKNTFTVGDINIDLKEHDYDQSSNSLNLDKLVTAESDYKMVPGLTMPKDPFVTVVKNSEPCWLFVEVTESSNLGTYMTYEIDTTVWTKLDGVDGVYYVDVAATKAADETYNVLKNKQVVVKGEVTKAQMEAAKASNPTLTFRAYAIQKANLMNADGVTKADTAAEAWALVK